MSNIQRYAEAACATIQRAFGEQAGQLERVAGLIADAIAAGRVLHVAGAGHSQLIALDAYIRAGGLAGVNAIADAGLSPAAGRRGSMVERLEGYAAAILDGQDLQAGDVAIVVSNSGVNAVPVELALGFSERGLVVVALTSLAHSASVPARHPSGKKLSDLADFVIDTHCPVGDAALEAGGARVGPLSTVVGAALVTALTARAAELLAERGTPPPVLVSQNLGHDTRDANQRLLGAARRGGA
jgi:uncharacterized phosphosugar-binding protein